MTARATDSSPALTTTVRIAVVLAHAEGRLSHADQLPDGLRSVVLQALAQNPAERPATPSAFADALRARFEPT